jgi:hypothetical protein
VAGKRLDVTGKESLKRWNANSSNNAGHRRRQKKPAEISRLSAQQAIRDVLLDPFGK